MQVSAKHMGIALVRRMVLGLAIVLGPPASAQDRASVTTDTVEPLQLQHVLHPKHKHPAAAPVAPTTIGVREPANYEPDPGIVRWYQERSATLPVNEHPIYCHGYGCEFQTPIPISDADFAELQRIFAARAGSAVEERKAISASVQWWERHASPLLGGPPRVRGDTQPHRPGQTDCLDEATNSTTILVYLERHKFLKYHRVERPEARGMLLYSHATAVIKEIAGEAWVVDMWMYDMGDPPDMPTYAEWASHW
ncbi:MAG: hypothetical protein P4L98_14980 [Ancalomicrobiaceae bacterium]|nr:hypothetical protein [Ancalomicrobiaceae bacterium]